MITCSRCGKENQDLYKFCLGCGAKLQAGAAAPAPKPAPPVESFVPTPPPEVASRPSPVAKTEIPPEPELFAMGGPAMPAMKPSVGVGGLSPSPFDPPVGAHPAGPSVQIGLDSVPMQVPQRASALAHPPMAQPSVPVVQAPHASPFSPPPVENVACPACGKLVASAFAFCGGCGHRMKAAPGAVAEAAIARPEPVVARVAPRAHLTLIRPDGTEGGAFALQEGSNIIGRGHGALFDSDPYLSPRHAEFVLGAGGIEVRDLGSLNGIFVRITEEEPIETGDTFRIGQELLRFDVINPVTPLEDGTEVIGTPNPGYWGRLSVVVGRDLDGPAFPLFDDTARLGRERGDILFPEDGYVSGAHCQLSIREGRVFLKDLGSSNGSFLRVRGSRVVPTGTLMLMGQQLFRIA